MGFTLILLIMYVVLLIVDGFALINGIKQRKWRMFIFITSIIVISICILNYLWITSPM